MRLSEIFTALRYPNFRLWFIGQIVSLFGTWMQSTAQGFLVFQLTQSPAWLGYISFAAGLPAWMLMLYGGVIADRVPRRTLLMVTQAVMMLLALILAALAFTGLVQPWHILVLAALLGAANAFDAPARLSLPPDLVDKADITNAVALNATMFNTAAIVGPSVAGIVYDAFGPAWCFLLNGLSFVAVIIALALMRLPPRPPARQRRSAVQDVLAGLRYLTTNRIVLALVCVIAIFSLFGYSFITVLPAWAVNVMHGGARMNGLLRSAQGVGALVGALFIASLGRFRYRGRLYGFGLLAFPLLLLAFSLVDSLPLTLATLVALGLSTVMINNLSNSLVQSHTSDEYRGRVMSIYSLTFFGLMPIGGLMIGQMAEWFNEPLALSSGALLLLVIAVGIWWRLPALRRLE